MEHPNHSPYKGRGGPGRLLGALRNALAGLAAVWRSEAAFRQEVALCAVLAPIAVLGPVSALERVALLASLALVLIVELLNSAIEAVVDRVSLDRHPLSAHAKDAGSAAVLLSLLVAAATWGTIWIPLLGGSR
jgi:diacylglycerol kinase (ATP)